MHVIHLARCPVAKLVAFYLALRRRRRRRFGNCRLCPWLGLRSVAGERATAAAAAQSVAYRPRRPREASAERARLYSFSVFLSFVLLRCVDRAYPIAPGLPSGRGSVRKTPLEADRYGRAPRAKQLWGDKKRDCPWDEGKFEAGALEGRSPQPQE